MLRGCEKIVFIYLNKLFMICEQVSLIGTHARL